MLEALWFARKGDWERAHAIVQEHENETSSALVHAHLHRVEGDLSNAGYWYRRAGHRPADVTLDEEWKALAERFLEESKEGPDSGSAWNRWTMPCRRIFPGNSALDACSQAACLPNATLRRKAGTMP